MIALLRGYAERLIARRKPNFEIIHAGVLYLQRWWVIPRNMAFCVYVHLFHHSDEDRALHDHRSINLSILLRGRYREHTIRAGGVGVVTERRAGTLSGIKFRLAHTAHRIELYPEETCTTLFITGPNLRNWGFHCPKAWRPWTAFTEETPDGEMVGCD